MKKNLSKNEVSEVALFKARVLAEMGQFSAVVEWLNKFRDSVLDSVSFREKLLAAYLELGDERAGPLAQELIRVNSENSEYHIMLQRAKSTMNLTELYREIQRESPRAHMPFRAFLNLIEAESFTEEFDKYIRPRLIKGIPSLYNDIRDLTLKYPEQIRGLVEVHVESLGTHASFARISDYVNFTWEPEEAKQEPQVLMWSLFLAARVSKDPGRSLECINKAIGHTPTLPDLYLVKGKLLKRAGHIEDAIKAVNKARKLDLSDRFLNNKTVKYLLRGDQIEEAERTIALFSKERENELNIHEMQSMWYELELGESHFRQEQYEKTVEQLNYIEKHLREMYNDQSDFHFYCMCKMNLNIYIDFLKFTDELMSSKLLLRAGKTLLKVYFKAPELYSREKALGLSRELVTHHAGDLELAELAFHVFLECGKHLLCLKCYLKSPGLELREKLEKGLSGGPQPGYVSELVSRLLTNP